ncbi:MAG: lipopolysaccharide biosynthesis protein [Acidobacteriota bacterium]
MNQDGSSRFGSRAFRGGAARLISYSASFLLKTGATVVLARVLDPTAYGLVGMVAVVVNFLGLFKDIGLSSATIQRENLTRRQLDSLFWLNLIVSAVVALFAACLSPLLAWFYGESRVFWITMALAPGFVFAGLGIQHQALLAREMRFERMAVVELSATALSLAVALTAALLGAGYWALVLQQMSSALAVTLGFWLVNSWRPRMVLNLREIRELVGFGANLTGFNVLNYFSRNSDNFLIGKFWGAVELGLYSKAYSLFLLPLGQLNAPLQSVALSTLSRLSTEGPRYRRAYQRLVEKICMLAMPLVAFMFATNDWIIRLLLGNQWVAAGPMFAALCIAGLAQPVANSTGWLFMSQDRTREMLNWGAVGSALSVLSIVVGVPWGGLGVATSYAVSAVLIRDPLLFWFAGRKGPVSFLDFYRFMMPGLLGAVAVCGAVLALRQFPLSSNVFFNLVITGSAGTVATMFIYLILPQARQALRDLRETALTVFLESRTAVRNAVKN